MVSKNTAISLLLVFSRGSSIFLPVIFSICFNLFFLVQCKSKNLKASTGFSHKRMLVIAALRSNLVHSEASVLIILSNSFNDLILSAANNHKLSVKFTRIFTLLTFSNLLIHLENFANWFNESIHNICSSINSITLFNSTSVKLVSNSFLSFHLTYSFTSLISFNVTLLSSMFHLLDINTFNHIVSEVIASLKLSALYLSLLSNSLSNIISLSLQPLIVSSVNLCLNTLASLVLLMSDAFSNQSSVFFCFVNFNLSVIFTSHVGFLVVSTFFLSLLASYSAFNSFLVLLTFLGEYFHDTRTSTSLFKAQDLDKEESVISASVSQPTYILYNQSSVLYKAIFPLYAFLSIFQLSIAGVTQNNDLIQDITSTNSS
jgi:hypothetical protein